MPPLDKNHIKRKQKLDCELKRIIARIKELDPEKIILFGSVASGNISFDSDIDLIIIKETDKRFLKRLEEVYSYIKPRTAIDILVYTPREFESLLKESDFIKAVAGKGTLIYEKEAKGSN
ncbi:MAG: nucleotidyltransferase domain-containing protein [Actinomycetota bacterium]